MPVNQITVRDSEWPSYLTPPGVPLRAPVVLAESPQGQTPKRADVNDPRCWPKPILKIVRLVAMEFGVTIREMRSQARDKPISLARGEALRRIKAANPEFSLPHLGRFFRLHHTTVMYHLKAVVHQPEPFDFDQPDESGVWAC